MSSDEMTQARVEVRGGGADALSLRQWVVTGRIDWPVARVRITQLFENLQAQPLEVIYTFPLSSEQVLERFELQVNGRLVHSHLVRAEEAEERYERRILSGDTAVQLRSERSNVFSLMVGNLAPGECAAVQLFLSQVLQLEKGRVLLRVPTVVGPRYIPGSPEQRRSGLGWAQPTDAVPDADWITPPVSAVGVPYSVSAGFHVSRAFGLTAVESPSHPFRMEMKADGYEVSFGEENAADRDMVLELYGRPEVARCYHALQYKDQFIAALHLTGEEWGRRPRRPLDAIFLLDVSGSMSGTKLQTSKKALRLSLRKLQEGDRFRMVAFHSLVHPFAASWLPFNDNSLKNADRWIDALRSMGGTELLPALQSVLTDLAEEGRERVLVLLTDGEVGNESAIVKLLQRYGAGLRLLLLAIDTAVNEHLFQEIQRVVPALTEYVYPGAGLTRQVNALFEALDVPWVRSIRAVSTDNPVQHTWPALPQYVPAEGARLCFLQLPQRPQGPLLLDLQMEDDTMIRQVFTPAVTEKSLQESLLKNWGKQHIRGLLNRGEVRAAVFGGRRQDALRNMVEAIALDLQLETPYTRWIAELDRDEKLEEIPEVQVVPVALPDQWEGRYFLPSAMDSLAFSDQSAHSSFEMMEFFARPSIEAARAPGAAALPQRDAVAELLLLQQADGSFAFDWSEYRPLWNTLVAAVALLHHDRLQPGALQGYESNFRKSLLFLGKHRNEMNAAEKVLWEFILKERLADRIIGAAELENWKAKDSDRPDGQLFDRISDILRQYEADLPGELVLEEFEQQLSAALH